MSNGSVGHMSASFAVPAARVTPISSSSVAPSSPECGDGVKMLPMHQPKFCTEELDGIESQLESLDGDLSRLRDNLIAIHKEERMPHPGISPEGIHVALQPLLSALAVLDVHNTLTINAIYRLDSARLHALLVQEQLRVYHNERDALLAREPITDHGSRFVGAILVRQPRSQPIKRRAKRPSEKSASAKKTKKAQLQFDVKLIRGAVLSFDADLNSVIPRLSLLEDTRSKVLRGSEASIEMVAIQWIPEASVVSISIVFPDGTQVVPSLLNVSVKGLLSGPYVGSNTNSELLLTVVDTVNAKPLVITTNENQWEHAEARLMRRQMFGDVDEDRQPPNSISVPWPYFSNVLTEFFMRATRQDITDAELLTPDKVLCLPQPMRSLTQADIAFLHERKFDRKSNISLADFITFWEWFGPLCHQYRHNQPIRTLFLRGLIFGFISKEDCVNVLSALEPGAFLIRNSERSTQGEFTLAFVNSRGQVKHHKIDHKKLKPPFGNMADFVREKEQLRKLVKPFHENNGVIIQQMAVTNKMDAFAEFYSMQRDSPDEQYTSYLY